MDAHRRAVDLAPDETSFKLTFLSDLGGLLQIGYGRLGEHEDAEAAIQLFRRAIDITPDDHLDRPLHLHKPGVAFDVRYRYTGLFEDIENAVWVLSSAASLMSAGHEFKAVGFQGVVATMWSIGDADAPIVVEAYYQKLLALREEGNLGKGETGAAYALHEAISVMRERIGESNFLSWAPFVHLGV